MNKRFIAVIGVLLCLAFISFYVREGLNTQSQTTVQPTRQETVNTIKVVQQIGTIKESHKIEKGLTALNLLAQTQSIESKGGGKDAFIVTINGRKADEKKKEFWAFYVNGKQAEVGAGSYQLQDGDTVLWKIETY